MENITGKNSTKAPGHWFPGLGQMCNNRIQSENNPIPISKHIHTCWKERLIWNESNRGNAKPKLKNRQRLFINVRIYLFIYNMFGCSSDLFSWVIFCPAAQSLGLASREHLKIVSPLCDMLPLKTCCILNKISFVIKMEQEISIS